MAGESDKVRVDQTGLLAIVRHGKNFPERLTRAMRAVAMVKRSRCQCDLCDVFVRRPQLPLCNVRMGVCVVCVNVMWCSQRSNFNPRR